MDTMIISEPSSITDFVNKQSKTIKNSSTTFFTSITLLGQLNFQLVFYALVFDQVKKTFFCQFLSTFWY